jgi:hypothetical protein
MLQMDIYIIKVKAAISLHHMVKNKIIFSGSSNGILIIKIGTIYEFEYNKSQKEITLYKNGSKLGVPFKNVDTSKTLYPAFEFYDPNSTIEIINKENNSKDSCIIN